MKNTLLILIALLTSTVCLAQKEKIELKLVKGETYVQRMASNMNISQDLGGQNMVIDMEVTGKINYKVTNVIDTVYDIEIKYESLGLKMDVQGRSMSYSSETVNTGDVFGKILQAMTKKNFSIKLSKKGKVIEVKNVDNLFAVFEDFTELTAEQKQQLKTQLAESYGENAFKGNLETSMAIFPSTAVAKGESWKTKTALRSKMAMDIQNTFTLKEITDSYYVITCASVLNTDPKADFSASNGFDIKYNLNGTMTAEIKLDKKTGWVVSSTYIQNVSGSNIIKAGEKIPDGMTIPMILTNKMVFTNN